MKTFDKQTLILCLSFVGLVGLGGCGSMANAYIAWWVLMAANVFIFVVGIIGLIISAFAKAEDYVLFFQGLIKWTAIIFMVGLGCCGTLIGIELAIQK